MASSPSLVGRHAMAKRIAESAMQERKGEPTTIGQELESYDKLIEDDARAYLGRGTPAPGYLTTEASQLWVVLLDNAPEMHFKQTEIDLLAQYCWLTTSLRTQMGTSAMSAEKDELSAIVKIQNQVRNLSVRLRLSPNNTNSMLTQERINNRKAMVEEMQRLSGKPTGRRASLLFGGKKHDLQ